MTDDELILGTRVRTPCWRYGILTGYNFRGIATVEFNDGTKEEFAYSHVVVAE